MTKLNINYYLMFSEVLSLATQLTCFQNCGEIMTIISNFGYYAYCGFKTWLTHLHYENEEEKRYFFLVP